MGSNYVFSLTPTFTQGLILGQFSIIILIYFILKYLFLDSIKYPSETTSYHPRVNSDSTLPKTYENKDPERTEESAEWFNVLLHQILDVYRSKLRDDKLGLEGDEIARKRVEEYANKMRPTGFLDRIVVHSVNLGSSAPTLFNGRHTETKDIEFDVEYVDTASVSLSTSYLFNYPTPLFARLPVSITISLSLFKSSVAITPPQPSSPAPVLTLAISPEFTLDLSTASLMGSRAKLANVPKLHELIQHQVHRILKSRGTWKVVLPGLATVAEAKEEVKKEMSDL
ncbi:ERMES complex subunit mmm1 [Stygiomarasmius scandens]|uniref:Maintenance of mitochondrial morphology protein 1 n=1 Tax=Marasmiellus scandens TaxID=2682957 RepID=A0ABR1JRS2_9AGAR